MRCPQKFFLKKSVDNCPCLWYNGLASEGEGRSPSGSHRKKCLTNAPAVWYTGDSREGNQTTPQKKSA